MISLGALFPEFSLLDQTGRARTRADFAGKWVVLYFYPKDNTPGCTIEGVGFSKKKAAFTKLGAEVVGVSKDTVKSHQGFCEKQELRITLLSDPERVLYKAAEVGTKSIMGHLMFKRSTVILNPKGIVAWTKEDVAPLAHPDECLEIIAKLTE